MIRDIKLCAASFCAGLLVAAGVCAWIKYRPSLPSVLAPPAKELAKEETATLNCKPVMIYRDRVKEKLGLPPTIQKDPDKKVTASTKVPADDHPHTVTSVYDTSTGATDLYIRRDPLPWLAFDTRRELGVAYGFKDDADGAVARVFGKLDLVQIKALRAGLLGNVDSDGDWYAGAAVSLRW